MNLCKNDCAFSGPQYQPVITSPGKSSNNKSGNSSSRYSGKIKALDGLWLELKNAALETLVTESSTTSSSGGSGGGGMVSCLPILRETASNTNPLAKGNGNGFRIDCTQLPIHRKSHQRLVSIKNLFSNAPKFQKNFQRGVFLSTLIYSEDKILLTMDDVLPTFQIEEDLSSSFQHDFHWLHKISSIWNDAKFLKQEIEKCDSASTFHFRVKLLQTVVTMQDSLDLRDLGKMFYKPITTGENNNVTFLCTVNHLRSPKLVSNVSNVKWIPIEKFKCKKPVSDTYQVLSSSVQSLMSYHQVSNLPLGKGLYLGYFKLVSSVDQLKLIVPDKTPSILPHVKIRNNPQVSKAEWELLSNFTKLYQDQNLTNNNDLEKIESFTLTEAQQAFRQQLDSSLKKLFASLRIDRSSALNHRFYTTEIIEVSSSVALIIVLPPTENACCIEGDLTDLKWIEDNKLMTLPVQVFEMSHMLTYHNTLARRLMRLSSTLEVETVLAQHNRRKAFSTEEMCIAQSQLSTLTNLHTKLEQTWRECRWMLEVVKAARAKDPNFVTLREFLNRYNSSRSSSPQKNSKNSINSSSTPGSSSPTKKLPKGTYVNVNQPFSRLQLQQLLNLRKVHQSPNHGELENHAENGIQQLAAAEATLNPTELPGPSIPCNPNFKFESCSSLPIVGKAFSSTNFDKLRTSASLFELQLGSKSNSSSSRPRFSSSNSNNSTSSLLLHQNLQHCTQEFMNVGLHLQTEDEPETLHYQNVQEVQEEPENHDYQNLANFQNQATYRPPLPPPPPISSVSAMQQELDCYMKHQSSRSKLVSLTTMTNRLRVSGGGGDSCNGNGNIANFNANPNIRTLSWTKQRTSLDRCFNLNLDSTNTTTTNLSCSSICSGGSRSSSRELLLVEEDPGNETDSSRGGGNGCGTHMTSKVVEIYAAYDCGLCTGTCVRLQISWDTAARQIIRLLIDKLNDEVDRKTGGGSSTVCNYNVDEFCLVSVLGARERVLRMDYKPLRLQKPWDCARLFVRRKNDVTAAVSLDMNLKSQKS